MSPEQHWLEHPARTVVSRRDGAEIPVYETGAGDPLLLLHGWTLDRRSFAGQTALGRDFHLVAPDRRGCGASAAEPNLAAECDDIEAVIDALGADRVHLLGVSQGARVALRYAALQPQRLKSLILQGPVLDGYSPSGDDSTAIPLAEYAALAARGDLDTLREHWLAHPLMNSETLTAEQSRALREIVAAYDGRDLLASAPAASAIPDLPERLASAQAPVLLLSGERETASRRAHCQRLLEIFDAAGEVVLSGCGHLCNFSRPDAYNAAVRTFIASVVAAGS